MPFIKLQFYVKPLEEYKPEFEQECYALVNRKLLYGYFSANGLFYQLKCKDSKHSRVTALWDQAEATKIPEFQAGHYPLVTHWCLAKAVEDHS